MMILIYAFILLKPLKMAVEISQSYAQLQDTFKRIKYNMFLKIRIFKCPRSRVRENYFTTMCGLAH